MTQTIENCTVEYDTARGVYYVHSPDGETILRICRLQRNRPYRNETPADPLFYGLLDITAPEKVSYPEN